MHALIAHKLMYNSKSILLNIYIFILVENTI